MEEAVPGILHPAFFGAPQIKKARIIVSCQESVLQRVKKTLGQPARRGMRAVDLQIESQRSIGKSAQPPIAAVGNGEVNVGGAGKGGFPPK